MNQSILTFLPALHGDAFIIHYKGDKVKQVTGSCYTLFY